MKVMSEESAWDLLLDVFAARAMTSDYLPGDELAYTRYIVLRLPYLSSIFIMSMPPSLFPIHL